MRRILLVKTSSLGDVVHNLPVVCDLQAHVPDIEVDWAVEKQFSAIPALHPGVSQVIAVEPRRWRRSLGSSATWKEIGDLRSVFRTRHYDCVVDTQGLIKSAIIARLAPGRRYGLDWSSAREPLRPFYHRTFHVSWSFHAVERNRQLAAQAMGYAIASPPDYGIALSATAVQADEMDSPSTPHAYAVLLHATSGHDKLWPEHQWVKLGDYLHHRGLRSILPWGSDEEHARSERIAKLINQAEVAPRLSLRGAAGLLSRAHVVFGVDTGLTHLAVAVGASTVGIYCATDPSATGLYGSNQAVSVGSKEGPPPVAAVIAAWQRLAA